MDTWDSQCTLKHVEKPSKILEWGTLPLANTSSSEGAGSDSSSCQIGLHSGAKKVTGHPPQGTDLSSEQECTRSFSGHTEGGVGCLSLSPFSNLSLLPKVLSGPSALKVRLLLPRSEPDCGFPIMQTPGLASWGSSPLDSLCSPSSKGLLFTDLHKSCSPSLSKTVLEPCADLHHQHTRPQLK